MKRLLVYRPAAQRELQHIARSDEQRIIRALEEFAATGPGDVKALKGAMKGRYLLRVGKWRIFFSLAQPGSIVVTDVDKARPGLVRWGSLGFNGHLATAIDITIPAVALGRWSHARQVKYHVHDSYEIQFGGRSPFEVQIMET